MSKISGFGTQEAWKFSTEPDRKARARSAVSGRADWAGTASQAWTADLGRLGQAPPVERKVTSIKVILGSHELVSN